MICIYRFISDQNPSRMIHAKLPRPFCGSVSTAAPEALLQVLAPLRDDGGALRAGVPENSGGWFLDFFWGCLGSGCDGVTLRACVK